MKVAYVFSTPNAHYILRNMIVPQMESGDHGFDVAGVFFFVDNTFMLVRGNDVGEHLSKLAAEKDMLLMGCDKCVRDRNIQDSLVDQATIGCFPDLHQALAGVGVDQVITL
jgi:hypothetical protein